MANDEFDNSIADKEAQKQFIGEDNVEVDDDIDEPTGVEEEEDDDDIDDVINEIDDDDEEEVEDPA